MFVIAENDHARVLCSEDQGTFKVESKDKSFRGKTFKGEMAWCNARRYVNDMLMKNDHPYWDRLYW